MSEYSDMPDSVSAMADALSARLNVVSERVDEMRKLLYESQGCLRGVMKEIEFLHDAWEAERAIDTVDDKLEGIMTEYADDKVENKDMVPVPCPECHSEQMMVGILNSGMRSGVSVVRAYVKCELCGHVGPVGEEIPKFLVRPMFNPVIDLWNKEAGGG